MPESLWAEAVAMATRHGAWWVAQALRLNYASLKARMPGAERAVRLGHDAAPTFVEVKVAEPVMSHGGREAVVELTAADGARLVVRAPDGVDVLRLAEAFWSRRS